MSNKRGKKKFIDKNNSSTFEVVYRSQADPLYGSGQASDRVLKPVKNLNVARRQRGNQSNGPAPEDLFQTSKPQTNIKKTHSKFSDDSGEDDDYDSDNDEDNYDKNFEDDEDNKEDPKKQKEENKWEEMFGGEEINAKEYDLGEYGFPEDGYDYSKHFKPMGKTGAVFMRAPNKDKPKQIPLKNDTKVSEKLNIFEGSKPQKPKKQLEETASLAMNGQPTTDLDELFGETIDFLEDQPDQAIPDDILTALENPESFEEILDTFIEDAEVSDEEGTKKQTQMSNTKSIKTKSINKKEEMDLDDFPSDENYTDDSDFPDLEDEYDEDIKSKTRSNDAERGEFAAVFAARVDKMLENEYQDDDIGELDPEDPAIHGSISLARLSEMMEDLTNDPKRKVLRGAEITKAFLEFKKQEMEEDENKTDNYRYVVEDEGEAHPWELMYLSGKRDEWDCESITSTYTNTENHPKILDEEINSAQRILLSKKTGIPLSVIPGKDKKVKIVKKNMGKPRAKQESAEDRKNRKRMVKEAKKLNRADKKALKNEYKREEITQSRQQAQSKQSVIKY